MIETRTLVRDVLKYGPDGNAVRRTETVEVEIRCPGGLREKESPTYDNYGEWRLLPQAERVTEALETT